VANGVQPLVGINRAVHPEQSVVPPTGLIGFEQAQRTGLGGASSALLGGQVGSEAALLSGQVGAEQGFAAGEARQAELLRTGQEQALGQLGAGFGEATGFITGGEETARQDIQAGAQGQEIQSALAGLLGPEAQAQAFAQFQASPGQEFLTEQAERALLRNQAATGGLGGGNVLQELQRQAIGLAQQDFF